MMAKAKLTAALCRDAMCEAGRKRTDYWDDGIPGFVLECRVTGSKTYTFRYFDAFGKQRQFKIGGHGDISFDQARRKAQKLRAETMLGQDPMAEKQQKKEVPTYAALAEQHLANAKTYQRSYATTELNMRRHIVPRWGKLRLTDIDKRDVAQWLVEKGRNGLAPATVEKLRVTFSRSFELGLEWGIPGCERNPVRGIKRPPINNARERFLTPEEAHCLKLAVAASRNTQLPHIVGLLLLTGARVSELLKAEWRHVDVGRRAWLILTSKTGKARHVPLSQAAIDLIRQLPRFSNCPFLVPNPDTLKPFVSIKHGWDKARTDAGLGDLRIHDLRHSAASFMINGGVDLFAVGKVLGHASIQSTQRYSHLANDTLLAAVEAGAAKQLDRPVVTL